uniref:Exonuclease domain-containing protein n=1 Tax=viral metagenome TaxID=1070528 RepID=A0A6C0BU47_9ZZZZ
MDNKILIFDTETSGLPELDHLNYKQKNELYNKLLAFDEDSWANNLQKFPELMQLTYFIYNLGNNQVEKIYDNYVNLDDETKRRLLNKITNEKNNNNNRGATILENNLKRLEESNDKKNLDDMVTEFLNDVKECKSVVGHNIDFDILMMISSAKRTGNENAEYLSYDNLNKVCTMKNGVNVCKIQQMKRRKGNDGNYIKDQEGKFVLEPWINIVKVEKEGEMIEEERPVYKPPKLIELFKKLYNIEINEDNLHDSKYDVLITLLVYIKMQDPEYNPLAEASAEASDVMKEFYKLVNDIMNTTPKIGGKKRKTRRNKRKTQKRRVKRTSKRRVKRKSKRRVKRKSKRNVRK